MEDDKIINVVYKNREVWTDEQIGEFVRRALSEDITQEDLEKDMGLNRRGSEMAKASDELLKSAIKFLGNHGFIEEEIMDHLHISRAKVNVLREAKV